MYYKQKNLSDCNGTRTYNHLVCKWTLDHLVKLAKWSSCVVYTYLYGGFDCMFLSCHVRISEWITLYSYLNVTELLARNRHDIWSLSDCNGTRMHRTDKYSQHSSNIWLVWVNGWVIVYELFVFGFDSRCCHLNSAITPVWSKEFLDIQATIECGFTLKYVRGMIRTYRLVSILPLLSKVYERVIYEQTPNYFEPFFSEILCGLKKAHSK